MDRKIHGELVPLWKKYGSGLQKNPPIPCDFFVGDWVVFTNDSGCNFDCIVIGFSPDANFQGRFIHIIRRDIDSSGSAWWFPHRPSELVFSPRT